MPDAHYFTGDKGGVGKSTLCRTAAQYHIDRGIDFALYDADRCNADVDRIYSDVGCQKIILSENRKHQDEGNPAYLSAIDKPTLVNLPAQVIDSFQNWFDKNDLSEMAKEDGVNINLWFVCNGQVDSLTILEEYFKRFQSKVKYVLVRNHGVCEDWKLLDKNDHIQKQIRKYKVKVIDFPELYGDHLRSFLDKESLTFEQAKNDQRLSRFDRGRVITFIKKAYQVFDRAKVFESQKSKPTSTSKTSESESENKGFVKKVVSNANS